MYKAGIILHKALANKLLFRPASRKLETYREMGFGDSYHLLSQEETEQRVYISGILGSLFTPNCATIHPGKLTRGLPRVVEAHGGIIYEQTAATGPRRSPLALARDGADRTAAKILELAG